MVQLITKHRPLIMCKKSTRHNSNQLAQTPASSTYLLQCYIYSSVLTTLHCDCHMINYKAFVTCAHLSISYSCYSIRYIDVRKSGKDHSS